MKRLGIVLALVPLLIVGACTPAEDDAMNQDVDTLQTETTGELEDWRTGADSSLAQIDEGLDSLGVQAEQIGSDVETEFNNTLADLRERRDSLAQELQQMDVAGDEEFDQARTDIERELNELDADIQSARDRYRDDNTGV